jgi:hypothetical protein
MSNPKKAKLNPSGTLSLLPVGRPSDKVKASIVTITAEAYQKLKAGKRVKYYTPGVQA